MQFTLMRIYSKRGEAVRKKMNYELKTNFTCLKIIKMLIKSIVFVENPLI